MNLAQKRGSGVFRTLPMLFLLLCTFPASLSAAGESSQAAVLPGSSGAVPTVDLLKSRIEEVAAATDLVDSDRVALTELYSKAISNQELASSHAQRANKYAEVIEGGAAEIARVREELEAAVATAAAAEPEDMALPEIEQQLQRLKTDLAVSEAHYAELQSEQKNEKERPAAIRQRLAKAKSLLAELSSTSVKSTANGESSELVQARRWVIASRREQLRTEALMLEQELSSQPMRQDLLAAKRDLAEFRLATLRDRVDWLEAAANRIRLDEAGAAKAEAQAAEREAASKHSLVADLASRNSRLSEEIDRLAKDIEGINRDEVEAAEAAKRIEERFNTTREKLEIAGLSQVLGRVLQQEKHSLPDTGHFRKQAQTRERKIAETSLAQIQLREERRQLRSQTDYVESMAAAVPEGDRLEVARELLLLANSRNELIDKALEVQRAYLLAMGELGVSQRRLQNAVERFDGFLDKRLLWVRSTERVGLDAVEKIPRQIAQLTAPQQWQELAKTLVKEVVPTPLFMLTLLFAVGTMIARRQLWRKVRESGANIGNILSDQLADTLRAIGLIILLALPIPALMLVGGWELRTSFEASNFTKLVGNTLVMLAPVLFQLRAFAMFLAPDSVARVHFGWREIGVQRLHRDVIWLTPLVMGLGFFVILALTDLELGSGSGLGRALFLALMATFTIFFYRLAKPGKGTLSILASQDSGTALYRLRYLWFALLVGPPVASALVSLAGYLYTAGTLIDRILQSAWFALLVVVVHQLILRWLTLNRRRLRLEAARAKRLADLEAREARETQDEGEGLHALEIEEPEIDLKALDAASRKLLNNAMLLAGLVGLWLIWRDVLPALQILDDVTLWSYTRNGENEIVPITLSSLALALLVVIVTIMATRQFPAFLEIVLLQHLDMSQGSRYTVTTLTRYTVVAVGVAWVFGFLGGSWSEIQWIFAALGVGIGFGLQEIVANFISGLIILFERPIRVGDVVTVGNTDGVVTRIQIRATTIRNWDRKELLVPNKNFITQELLNWSLSDQTTRIMIRIGVAYGSDVERALLIMEEVATEHPRTLGEPAPFCVFEEFGDNALLLSLRCYIDDIDHRLRTITELNLAINQRMAEAGIEIAFPQRDIHLDTRRPLDIRLHRRQQDPE